MKKSAPVINLGVIGCGVVSELRHLPALSRTSGIRVVALADSNSSRLNRVAGRYAVGRRYMDYRELIAAKGVDAVAVCVPPQLHTEIASAAVASGKHTFIEKPLALTLKDCALLSDCARRAGAVKVLVGHNLRWHRLVREAREIIRRGELGDIKLVRTVLTSGVRLRDNFAEWRRQRESGGGALFELGVHHFDLIRFLLAVELEEVYAASLSADETAIVNARAEGRVQIVSAFSEGTGENHEVEVYGARGWLRVSCYRADGLEHFHATQYPGSLATRLSKLKQTTWELPRIIRQLRHGGDYVATYASQWRHFADAIAYDTPVECTLADGQRALEIVLAAWEANATKCAVRLAHAATGTQSGPFGARTHEARVDQA
jgi:myo-inositol 2-dehydrogenase/D-chiro-inositol 1-dehydrogenase